MKKLVFYFLISFLPFQLLSQVNDFEVWIGSEISYDITKDLTISLEEEFRFFDNSTRLLEQHNDLQVSYDVLKWIRLGTSYRFSKDNDGYDVFENQHRFTFDVRFRKKIDRFRLSYRIRYQQTYNAVYASENGKVPNMTMRNRLTIDYDIKDFKGLPFVEFEYYVPINYVNNYHKYESTIGFEYGLSKKMDAAISYSCRRQEWSDVPLNRYILALSIDYDL